MSGPCLPLLFSTLASWELETPILCAKKRQRGELEAHEKPKVYQGVRVKMTVKELLQQRRAHQATSGATLPGSSSIHLPDSSTPSSAGQYNQLYSSLNALQKSISEAFQSLTPGLREAPPFNWTPTNQKVTLDANPAREERQGLPSFCTVYSVPRLCPSYLSQLLVSEQLNYTIENQGLYFEPEPMSSTPSYFQPREFSTCVSCEESPSCLDQIFESYLQTETLPGPLLNSTPSAPHYFPDSCQVAPSCYNQSLTPESPSDSSSLSGSFDCSYSPAQLPPYTPENYTSPSLDSLNHSLPEEGYLYHHHWPSHTQYNHFTPATPSVCYCASCEAEHLDTFRTTEFFSYSSTDYVDFAPSAATTSDFYKRETSCDACYS